MRDGRVVLLVPGIDYADLTDLMFDMIRHNMRGSPTVVRRQLEVLTAIAAVERTPSRLSELQRHADLLIADARRDVTNGGDLAMLDARHRRFGTVRLEGPRAWDPHRAA